MQLVSAPEIAEAITPEIQALARGLENDPKQIFDYIHDHIRYVHYFGSKKGAQLTLLERSGNDFDQCALLVAMLRAAGHTASYQFGFGVMTYESQYGDDWDFKHWIGLTMDGSSTSASTIAAYTMSLNDRRGYPYSYAYVDGTNVAIVLHRVWVKLTWNDYTYSLDPAFKTSRPLDGIDLATAMRLDTNQLMTAAAGTSNADYVVSLSEANLRNKLRDYTTNLVSYLQSSNPNSAVEDIVGGQFIETSFWDPLDQNLPFTVVAGFTSDWENIPTNLMTTLNITVDATTNQLLFMPQLQGQKLALTFSTNGIAQLWLEDDLLLQKQTSSGEHVDVVLGIDHPHGSWDFTTNTLINSNRNDHITTNTYQRTNASYAITYAFEADQEWLRHRQDRLDRYREQGLADTSREVVTETLNIMGLNWMLQTERIARVLATQQDMLLLQHHRFGRMAQEYGKGYYIDIGQQLSGHYPANGNGVSDLARGTRIFDLQSYFSSAAEHALIEQLQSSGLVAASTVKMLQIGNANGQRTYQARSNNWAAIQSSLSNYDKTYLKNNFIDKGYTLLLPANGSNVLAGAGSWAGYGIVARGGEGGFSVMSMLISGGYHGGYVANPGAVVDPPCVDQASCVQPNKFNQGSPLVPAPYSGDPVSMVDGSFKISAADLTLGQPEPRGIRFTRYYSSSRRLHNFSGIAHGWTHNYDLKAVDVSAPLAGLGDTTPAQMAPIIAATKSAFALYNTNGSPKNWAVTALIAKWGLDQLINNAVSVTLGEDTIQFIKQPDGTYTPPAKSTMTMYKTNGVYRVRERHGNTYKFNSVGLLTNIVDLYSQNLTVAYDSSNRVSTIKDWKNRTLTLTYSGSPQRLDTVADNTGRSVSYDYTTTAGQTDLTSVTDPENKASTFVYDTNHQIVATLDALNRVVVSNNYDGFGRVIEQYSKGDGNQFWRFFWSGYLNAVQDPAGGRKQYLFDDKHRLMTAVDAMNHYTQAIYDGQDHTIGTMSPLGACTYYYYDGHHNLIYTLDPLTNWTEFVYDNQDNLVRSVDARGNTSKFGYNAKYQMTGSTNGAGDWTTFVYSTTDGTLTSRTDPGGTTSYGYDTYRQLSSITYPGSLGSETFGNHVLGDVLSHTNARAFVTSFQYNNRRELTNTIAPTNLTSRVSMDAVGNVQAVTDPRGFTTSNTWSATRKLMSTTLPATPQGVPVATNSYDIRDWLALSLNPLQQATRYTNDADGRLVAVGDPLGHITRFGYDDDDRKTATTNAANEVTRQTWSLRGDLLQVMDPASHIVGRGYDEAGNQVWLTNRNGKVWQFHYDGANRLTNTSTPLGRQTKLVYNNRGLLQTVTEPSTQTASLYYDARGRLTNRTDGVGTVLHRYDANNNRTNVVQAGKTNAWAFDAYDRVSTYKDADGNLIQYRSDANGNVTNLVYPGGKTVSYAFDSLSRLTNVTDWASRKTGIEYDLASRVKRVTHPNGTVREMGYDAAGQTTNILERTASGTPIALFKFGWNAAARMDWEFAAPLPHGATPPTRSMTYDDDNRIATFNGQSVSYDLDGNLITGPLTNNTLVSYTYDARNRLVTAGGLDYTYDPAGNRVAVTNGTNITRLVVDPNAALSQVLMRVKSGVTNYYVYGLGLLYEADDAGATKTYHYNYRGSTVAITDDSGNVTDRVEYSAYGTTTYRSGNTDTPFLFNGRYGVQTDPNGLLYMRARYYNPYICRFINPDPSGFSGGLNHYAYADGNPVSLIDPFGLCPSEGWGGAVATWLQNNVSGPLNSVATGSTVANFASYMAGTVTEGLGDLLRVGQGSASAVDANNGWDAAIGITQDIGRAAGIATMVGGGFEGALGRGGAAAKTVAEDATYLYQKVGAQGEHLKFGITKNPATRYTQEELGGGRLKILTEGSRKDMLQLERNLHETLPIGPEEAQKFYIQKQIEKGLKPPPYNP